MREASSLTSFIRWPPLWVIGLLCLYLLGADVAVPVLGYFTGMSDNGEAVTIFPIFEEVLKLWLVLKVAESAFGAIVTFGLLELLLVKAPLMLEAQGLSELLFFVIVSLVAFTFHLATAVAYKSAVSRPATNAIFCICVTFHILFNSLSLFNLRTGVWYLSAVLICASVVASSRLVALLYGRSKRS